MKMIEKYSVLSNCDIEEELGENILIYPFKINNLKGASYNLTVSKLAWDIETGDSIYDSTNNIVKIEPGKTAAIQTNEAIWVSSIITGSYHSKVKYVTEGLSHIGTTLDPLYLGNSLITVHNYGYQPISWIPEEDTFASLVFYYVNTKSTIDPVGNNTPGRQDLLRGFKVSSVETRWLNESFRTDKNSLENKLKSDSIDFQSVLDKRLAKQQNQAKNKAIKNKKLLRIVTIISWILIVIALIYLKVKELEYGSKGWYDWLINGLYALVFIPPVSLMTYFLQETLKD
jgi:deoxycytidine triphosphate deaminase